MAENREEVLTEQAGLTPPPTDYLPPSSPLSELFVVDDEGLPTSSGFGGSSGKIQFNLLSIVNNFK